jgi:LemA protein
VLTYNNAIQVFPAVLLAGRLGFAQLQFFEVAGPGDREVPAVSFGAATGAGTDAPAG